jgi:hypothetical protein
MQIGDGHIKQGPPNLIALQVMNGIEIYAQIPKNVPKIVLLKALHRIKINELFQFLQMEVSFLLGL